MTGLHGVWIGQPENPCLAPRRSARIVRTAIGRRLQLFSPSPEKNGSASRIPNAITGPISRTGVSNAGGSNESSA